ncbi:MAG: outer membrane protein assembly factor BamD [Planctomycetota bacterium]
MLRQWTILYVGAVSLACLAGGMPPAPPKTTEPPKADDVRPAGPASHEATVQPAPAPADPELAEAKSRFDKGDLKAAARLFKHYVKTHTRKGWVKEGADFREQDPFPAETQEAQYFLAECYFRLQEFGAAGQAYDRLAEMNPAAAWIRTVGEREYAMGDFYYARAGSQTAMGASSSRRRALDFYSKALAHYPAHERATEALFRAGEVHLQEEDFVLAEEAFRRLAEDYPKSPLASHAEYFRALSLLGGWKGPPFDPTPALDALNRLDQYRLKFPKGAEMPEVEAKRKALREDLAEKNYNVARFYQYRRKPAAAKIYDEFVVAAFPETGWAARAKGHLGKKETAP